MAVSVGTPLEQICDNNGDPLSGGKLYVYDAGTTTPKALFTDPDLVSPAHDAANPIILDSAGRHAMTYFATGTYKVVVKTSADVTLFTRDNIDAGVPIGSGALAIANGGTGATSAGAARTNLGVPSQTEFDDLSADVADITNTLTSLTAIPQGRLTLTTGVPVMTGDVSAGTNVYYTPYIGRQIPIWNGSAFVITTFAETTLPLVANHVASTIYDLFIIDDGGTVRLVTGPAWNTSTAGSGSRGSGAGTTELTRQFGILVNANAMTARYGSSTVSVIAKGGTYVGSIYMDGTNGQVSAHVSAGTSRKYGIWNYYNRVPVILMVSDSTATWTYNSATVRQSRASSSNTGAVFVGVQEEILYVDFKQQLASSNAGSTEGACHIGYNSTTVASGFPAYMRYTANTPDATTKYVAMPGIGVNNINTLESAPVGTPTFNGTTSGHFMTIRYRA